jgi:undecaprenyl-diphosphatase
MLGATLKKGYDYYQEGFMLSDEQVNLLILGNIVGFVVALIAIKSFIGFLSKYGFKIFGYYRIIVGLAILFIHYFVMKLTVV